MPAPSSHGAEVAVVPASAARPMAQLLRIALSPVSSNLRKKRTRTQASRYAVEDREQPVGARGRGGLGVDRRGRARVGAPGRHAPRRPAADRSGPANWLHEQGYFTATWMVAGLPYDGLVAYRRVPGVAGEPSSARWPRGRRGRARTGAPYVFTLRRGIRYSDGTPIRPGDFRASVKRHLGAPSYAAFPPYFSGIVGARRCIRAGTRCDLSQGIESDGHARTITIHLTAPDPEFLHKLTLPMAYVVPSGTPANADDRASRRPVPARTASPAGTSTTAACSSATRTSARPPPGPPGYRTGSRSRSPRSDASRRTPPRSNVATRI
jgi:hypothetical protein